MKITSLALTKTLKQLFLTNHIVKVEENELLEFLIYACIKLFLAETLLMPLMA